MKEALSAKINFTVLSSNESPNRSNELFTKAGNDGRLKQLDIHTARARTISF